MKKYLIFVFATITLFRKTESAEADPYKKLPKDFEKITITNE
jgi:hypothetical protein